MISNKTISDESLRYKLLPGNYQKDMYLECEGLIAVMFHHASLYDNSLIDKNKDDQKLHLQALTVLSDLFTGTIQDYFCLKDKLSLLDKAQSATLRMFMTAKDENMKNKCNYILKRLMKITNKYSNILEPNNSSTGNI